MDFTGIPVHLKELMFLRVSGCSQQDMTELFRLSQVLGTLVIDYGPSAALLQSVQTERKMTIWYPCFSPYSPDGSKLCAAGRGDGGDQPSRRIRLLALKTKGTEGSGSFLRLLFFPSFSITAPDSYSSPR